LDQCEKDKNIKSVYLHVQCSNEEAISFYKNRNFQITKTEQQYYKKIDPADAYVLEKVLRS